MEGGDNKNNNTDNGGLAAETSWQSTKTTQAIIDYVKAQGSSLFAFLVHG